MIKLRVGEIHWREIEVDTDSIDEAKQIAEEWIEDKILSDEYLDDIGDGEIKFVSSEDLEFSYDYAKDMPQEFILDN